MNVLVYSGPEVLNTSFARSISLLKALLVPHYAVQPITLQSLTSNPWSETCALLVFPACHEQLSLPSPVRMGIKNFVEGGGSLLGLRASARVAGSGFASLNLQDFSLRFQDRSSGTSLSCSFIGDSPGGPTTIVVKSGHGDTTQLQTDSAPAEMSISEGASNVTTLAYHGDDASQAAAIACRIGSGRVVLWGVDVAISGNEDNAETESKRRAMLNDSLQHLALKLPDGSASDSLFPLPQFLTCSPARPGAVQKIHQSLLTHSGATLKDEHDTFAFHTAADGKKILNAVRASRHESDPEVKHIITYPDGHLPDPEDTPLFNISRFYSELLAARSKATSPITETGSWGIGEATLYGEVVTSTQTMLDKLSCLRVRSVMLIMLIHICLYLRNHRFLSSLPDPLLSIASHQVAGRGRGGNNWVSPSGCLQFSLVLRVPLKDVPAQKLVFIQYLFALAVVEACRNTDVLGPFGEKVRIKWPNDLYVVQEGEKHKVGGILVHSSFQVGVTTIVIGE